MKWHVFSNGTNQHILTIILHFILREDFHFRKKNIRYGRMVGRLFRFIEYHYYYLTFTMDTTQYRSSGTLII